MDRSQRAKANFLEGYNCAQSVALAFCEDFGFTKEQMARLVSGYGGGVGRMRELCGALLGAVVSTDRQKGYVRALREMGAAAHLRFASGGSPAPMNLVNAVHSALKAFLARFRGVSTRRLHGYLMWFKWQREARRLGDLPGAIREHMSSARYRLTWRERVREPYPFHPEMAVQIEG